jgi:acetyl esterase/lipase
LAALAGTTGGIAALEDLSMGNAGYSSSAPAIIDWYGPVDFLAMDSQLQQLGGSDHASSSPDSPMSKLVGGNIAEAPDLAQAASPLSYITSDIPPFLIQHGKADTVVPYLQSVGFAEKLRLVIGEGRVELDLIDGAGHGGPLFESDENNLRVLSFLDKWLK